MHMMPQQWLPCQWLCVSLCVGLFTWTFKCACCNLFWYQMRWKITTKHICAMQHALSIMYANTHTTNGRDAFKLMHTRRQHCSVWGCIFYRPCVEFHRPHHRVFAEHHVDLKLPPDPQSNRAVVDSHTIKLRCQCQLSRDVVPKMSYYLSYIH